LEDTKAFFALPEAVKQSLFDPENGGGQRGYTPFGTENAKGMAQKDLKEFWHHGRDLPEGHPYREVMPPNVSVAEIRKLRRQHQGALSTRSTRWARCCSRHRQGSGPGPRLV
jgi:isopenicillin N synthase-like dioxygenase